MYGKVMAVRDDLIPRYFLLCTHRTDAEIETIQKQLASGTNPRDIKMTLARDIVSLYHGSDTAKKAEENFVNTFSKGGVPDEIETITVAKGTLVVDVLLQQGIVTSKTDWRRLVENGAVTI